MSCFKRLSIEDYTNNEKWFKLHKDADAMRYDSETMMPIEAVYYSPYQLARMPAPSNAGMIPRDDESLDNLPETKS